MFNNSKKSQTLRMTVFIYAMNFWDGTLAPEQIYETCYYHSHS
jgi:hypothetical protein